MVELVLFWLCGREVGCGICDVVIGLGRRDVLVLGVVVLDVVDGVLLLLFDV